MDDSPHAPKNGCQFIKRASADGLDLWITVLSAKNIPFRLTECRGEEGRAIYVPPLLEHPARIELAAVAAEHPAPAAPPLPVRHNAHWALGALILLVIWHGLRVGWWGSLSPLSAGTWLELGSADGFKMLRRGEWYRAMTALTLHADSGHLFGNVLFGSAFLIMLCRYAGLGAGLLLVVLSGSIGNICNALYRPLTHSSIGFSSALFGTVGALSGFLAVKGLARDSRTARRQAVLLLAAGVGILAMLGTDGSKADYGAHLFGLLAGFPAGGAAALLPPLSTFSGLLAGFAALLALVLAWTLALS